MDSDFRLDDVVIKVNGSPLAATLHPRLTSVRVEESVHLPDLFTIRFEDAYFTLFDEDLFPVGAAVEIAFRAQGEPVVVTAGEVTAIEVALGDHGRHELTVTGLDRAHRLARGPRTRSFVQMSAGDIASRIAGEHGLRPDVDATGAPLDHVLQAAETDLAFLRRLAVRSGFDLWVTDRNLHFKKRPGNPAKPPPMVWGDNLIDFSVRFSSTEHCDEVEVTAWDPLGKKEITGRASDPDRGTDAPAAASTAAAASSAFGTVTRRAGHVPLSSQPEADAYAASLLRRAAGAEVVLRGVAAGNPSIGAGAEIVLSRVGERLAGRYRVTAVEHEFGGGRPYTTRFVCGTADAGELADLVGFGGGLPRDDGRALMVGLVTSNADPDKVGRVKVKFPTLSQLDESGWARVVTPGGGSQRGLQWTPEIGDEVLIGFECGDRSRPYVLGGLFSRTDQPPATDAVVDGATAKRALTSKAGHHLLFEDGETGAVELALTGDKNKVRLTEAESSLAAGQKLKISGDSIEITATQTLVLKAAQIEIEATGSLKATGKPIQLN